MDMTSAPERVHAEIVVYRILGTRDDYLSSRAQGVGDHELTFNDSPSDGDTTRLVIGGRPDDYITAWRRAWAWIVAGMGNSSEWRDAEDPVRTRDEYCDRLAIEVDLPLPLNEDCGLWATVSVSRPCVVSVEGEGRYFWARSTEIQTLSKTFVADVADHLDLVMAAAETATGIPFTVPVATSDRPLIYVAGRAPFSFPSFSFPRGSVSSSRPWDGVNFGSIKRLVQKLQADLPSPVRRSVSRAYRWLVMSIRETDELRSFLFAFVGIEGLASTLRKDLLPKAISKIQPDEGDQLPIEVLFWPRTEDDELQPNRNAVFQFAVLATALSSSTATSDVEVFKRLLKDRNKIAHGTDHRFDTFPVLDCQGILRRYISLVADYQW